MMYELLEWEEIKSFHIGARTLIAESELQKFIARSQLITRLNTALATKPGGHRVVSRLNRTLRIRNPNCGRHFLVDETDRLVEAQIDIFALGRELGVLAAGDENCV